MQKENENSQTKKHAVYAATLLLRDIAYVIGRIQSRIAYIIIKTAALSMFLKLNADSVTR